jgi:uncharacterized membrane protein YgcG
VSVRSPAVALVALLLMLSGVGTASAAEPLDLSDRVTDEAGVLGDRESAVRQAVDELAADSDIDLYAVLVSSFDTEGETDWVEETAGSSDLEGNDVLVAVSVDDGDYEYGWWVDDSFPLAEDDVQSVVDSELVPRLEAGDWGGGVIGMAGALAPLADRSSAEETSDEASPTWSATTTVLVVAGVAAVLLAGHVLTRRRTSARS